MSDSKPLIISRLPRDLNLDRDTLGNEILRHLLDILFEKAKTDSERELWERFALGEDVDLTDAEWRVLDEEIILQAESLGWRIGTCSLVEARFEFWEKFHPFGAELFERCGFAVATFARVMHRQRLPQVDAATSAFKAQCKHELSQVLTKMRATPSPRVDLGEQLSRAVREVGAVNLGENLESLLAFIRAEPHELAARVSAQSSPSPASFIDRWLSWATGYKDFRKKIAGN